MLIFCEKTYYTQGQYWLEHTGIRFYNYIILLIPFYIFIDYLYVNIMNTYKNKINMKKFYIISSVICIFIVSLASYITIHKYRSLENYTLMNKETKQYCYSIEKILRYNILNNKTNILLPKYKQENLILLSTDKQIQEFYKEVYYPSVYKEELNEKVNYHYVDEEQAMKEFYNSGGKLTAEELNDIKFSRLSDKNNFK